VINIGVHVVSGAPGEPQAKEVASTHIELSWTRPITLTDEEIIVYAVYFRSSTGPKPLWERLQTDGPEESIVISDLVKGDLPFIFKVCAISSSGEGAESEESDEILLTKVGTKHGSYDFEGTMDEDDKFQDSHSPKNLALGAAGALYQQEAMEVDHYCAPEEAFEFLMGNNLNCNLRVLGCQLGLRPSDLDTPLPPDQSSRPYQHMLFQILSKCSEIELLSWTKLASVLRKSALKQYRIANKICTTYGIMTGSSESDSIASLQSPRSGSLERSRTFTYSISDDSAGKLSKYYS
jgi:hypothetical protein